MKIHFFACSLLYFTISNTSKEYYQQTDTRVVTLYQKDPDQSNIQSIMLLHSYSNRFLRSAARVVGCRNTSTASCIGTTRLVDNFRSFSSTSTTNNDFVSIETLPDEKIAVLKMHRKPANSLSLEMMEAISSGIKQIEADPKIQAVIMSSDLSNNIFSAGLELTELYQPSSDRLPKFWYAFQQLYIDLYGSRLSTIAAMNGPAPAAGCMIALSCDYRIMTSNPKVSIGLNESQLGIVAPPWLCQQYIDTIGNRNAELALLLGTLFSPQKALEIGLVDQLTDESDDVLDAAKKMAAKFVKIPAKARIAAKDLTRGVQIEKLIKNRDDDTDFFCSFVTADSVQRTLGGYLEMLAKRKK